MYCRNKNSRFKPLFTFIDLHISIPVTTRLKQRMRRKIKIFLYLTYCYKTDESAQ